MSKHVRTFLPLLFLVAAGCPNTVTPKDGGAHDLTMDGTDNTPCDVDAGTGNCATVSINCDPVSQMPDPMNGIAGCTDPANPRCTYADDGTMMMVYIPMCLPNFGMVPKDGSCMRNKAAAGDTTGWSTIGFDNCAPGAYCSGYGSLNSDTPNRHCRNYCYTDMDCNSAADKCMYFSNQPMGYYLGICVPTCTAFGTDCPAGYGCSTQLEDLGEILGTASMPATMETMYYSCRTPGKVALDNPCPNGDSDCGANTICFDHTLMGMPGTCTAMCDKTHACPTGKMCTPTTTYPGSMGNPDFTITWGANGQGICL